MLILACRSNKESGLAACRGLEGHLQLAGLQVPHEALFLPWSFKVTTCCHTVPFPALHVYMGTAHALEETALQELDCGSPSWSSTWHETLPVLWSTALQPSRCNHTTFFSVDTFVAHVEFFVATKQVFLFFLNVFRGPLSGLLAGRFVAFGEPFQEHLHGQHWRLASWNVNGSVGFPKFLQWLEKHDRPIE